MAPRRGRGGAQGPYGNAVARLINQCKQAQRWDDINPDVIANLWRGYPRDIQAFARRIVSAFITKLRLRAGLTPFDDLCVPKTLCGLMM